VRSNTLDDAAPLVGCEEKAAVLFDWPAKRGAKLVLFQVGFNCVEVSPRVKYLIAEVLVDVSMKLVGAALGHYVNDRAGVATIFRVKGVGNDTELLNTIGRGLHHGEIGKLIVAVAAVHAVVVGSATSAVDRDYAWLVAPVEQI